MSGCNSLFSDSGSLGVIQVVQSLNERQGKANLGGCATRHLFIFCLGFCHTEHQL